MVLPPSKRQKAPKTAWTRCPSRFFTIPPSATSCTHRLTCRFGRCFCTLCRGLHRRPAPFTREAKKVYLFYSVRFSRFIDSLNRASQLARFLLIHYFSVLLIKAFNSSFGIKPTVLSTSSPFEKIAIAGIL